MNISKWIVARYKERPRLPARFHISSGLVSVVTSIVLLASFAGFVPDRKSAVLEGQLALSESIASSTSLLLNRGSLSDIKDNLEFNVNRLSALSSIVLSREQNSSDVTIGEAIDEEVSIIRFPLVSGSRAWGELLLQFNGKQPSSWLDRWRESPFALASFMAILVFPAFYFYLGKMLKELNPSSAVPGRVRSALDTIAEALIVIDRKGNIVLANSAFATLNGESAESLLGMQASRLDWQILGEDKSCFPWQQALDLGLPTRNAMTGFVDSEGAVRKFLVNCSPITGTEGRVGGVLISMDDVTLLEEKEMLLRQSMLEAEEANHAKSQFLSNMSHEIRTPMTAILGFTEVLRRGLSLSREEQQKHLRTISDSGQHLLELINDVLDLSKVESGAMEVEAIPTNICRIAQEVIKVLGVKAVEKSVELKMDLLTDLPEDIVSDPARLRQILTNLVGNAIKFTEQGSVSITIACKPADQQMIIQVVDTGIGMTAEQQASIFDAFTQADTSITRRFGGTGLGLSISRQLAEALGGGIQVSSIPGQGSSFTLNVPTGSLEAVPLKNPRELLEALDSVEFSGESHWVFPGKSVLVVDDAVENRDLLSLVLNDLGLVVTVASNGREALDILETHDFAAILMDIQMPVMDGFEAVAAIRAKGLALPVVALTANAMKGYEKKIKQAGFSHYQTKPINLDELTVLLASLLGGIETAGPDTKHRLVDDEATSLPQSGSIESMSGCEPLVSTLLDTDPRMQPIVVRFLEKLTLQVGSMRDDCDSQHWGALAEKAHWLKGSGGTVGFDQLSEPGSLLELAANSQDAHTSISLIQKIDSLAQRMCADNKDVPISAGSDETVTASETGSTKVKTAGDAYQPTQPKSLLSSSSDAVDTPVISTLLAQNSRFASIVERFMARFDEKSVQLESAYEKQAWESVAEIAHWLKGSGGSVGFDGYTSLAIRLEQEAKNHSPEQVRNSIDAILLYSERVRRGWDDAASQRKTA